MCGVDEAGRGPVIGPMVIAIVCIDDKDVNRLIRAGVRDSKELNHNSRVAIYRRIEEIAVCIDYQIVDPSTIDAYVSKHKLNVLEAQMISELVKRCASKVKVSKVYVDSPDVIPDRFSSMIRALLGPNFNVCIEAFNKADKIVPVVSAASIVAKCVREREIARLKAVYGDFGSGYPSDPRTISFIRSWIKRHGRLPEFVRKSWSTVKRIIESLMTD